MRGVPCLQSETTETTVVDKPAAEGEHAGHHHGHTHKKLRFLGVGAGRGQLARQVRLDALPDAVQCDSRHMTTGHTGQKGGSS